TLTPLSVQNEKPGAKDKHIPDRKAAGLYLLVRPTGHKSYYKMARYDGHQFKTTFPITMTLAAVRKAAAQLDFDIANGIDPRKKKKDEQAKAEALRADTFPAVCEEYAVQKREDKNGKPLRTMQPRIRMLRRHAFPTFKGRPISSIRRIEIVRL